MSEYFELPAVRCGAYVLYDEDGNPLYVGFSGRAIFDRLSSALHSMLPIETVRIYPCNSYLEAKKLETELITELRPPANHNGWKGKSSHLQRQSRGQPRLFNPEDEEAIKSAWRDGLTEDEIADTLGCSQMTISRIITGRYRNIK